MVIIVKKINKKYLIIGILVFVFVCLVSLGIYFSNKKENTNNNDDVKLVIKKDVSVEVMSELLNAKDFLIEMLIVMQKYYIILMMKK